MKKIILVVLIFTLTFVFAACGAKDNGFAAKEAEINAAINSCKMDDAYALCKEALLLELSDEEIQKVADYKIAILSSCYSGTFIVKAENIISVTPEEVGKNSYFEVSLLEKYDELFCRYTFAKFSEKELAAQEYKKYFDDNFTSIDINVEDKYTTYKYSDENGNGLSLQVFNDEYSSNDFCVILDKDLFDSAKIDMSNRSADLFDSSIIIAD